MFNLRVEEEEQLFEDWDALVSDPTAASRLLQGFSLPYSKKISKCRIHYRQLVSADKPGLVLDIAPLSENDLAFSIVWMSHEQEIMGAGGAAAAGFV